MKVLFLLLSMPDDIAASDMYIDLFGEFKDNGHEVTVMAPSNVNKTLLTQERGVEVLRVKAQQTQYVTNMLKKGIALALLPFFYKRAYKKYLYNRDFDWIFMPTPPITLVDFVSYLKKHTNAGFYLILRDIHPQSVASIGVVKNRLMYNYIEKRARRGYETADYIGCMSQGNIKFIMNNYPNLRTEKLVLLMNWQKDEGYTPAIIDIRKKYNLEDKTLVLFGGNIGLGQRVENIFTLAKEFSNDNKIVFLIVGKGVKKQNLKNLVYSEKLENVLFIDFLPRQEYLDFVKSVDIGLVSINENYKVPTCPSKAVSYMSLKIPIFAMINPNNDYGEIIEKAGAGFWTVGSDKELVFNLFNKLCNDEELRKKMGDSGYKYYLSNLTSKCAYKTIVTQVVGNEKT